MTQQQQENEMKNERLGKMMEGEIEPYDTSYGDQQASHALAMAA